VFLILEKMLLNIPVYVEFNESNTEINPEKDIVSDKKCEDIGRICSAEQVCSGSYTFTSQGNCCIGECLDVHDSDSSSSSFWIGVIIIVIVIGGAGAFIFLKSRKNKNPQNILKEKSKQAEQKFTQKK
jgi:hypothetical protein